MTYNTGNPLGSTDPRDLYDNAENLDNLVNGETLSYPDRFGVSRRTLEGVQYSVDAVLGGLGYSPPVAYTSGISLTLTTQTVEYLGQTYAPRVSSLPFTTSGTFETSSFRLIQGVSSADLAASSGSSLVGYLPLGTGAVAMTAQGKLRESVSVLDFGAVGDGVTDDTAEIQACFTYCGANKKEAVFPASATGYLTSDTVTLPSGGHLDMTGAFILYAGAKDRPAVVLGTAGALNLHPLYKNVSVVMSGAFSWPSTSHIGVRCINAVRGEIGIRYINGFTTGWECYADTTGYAYTKHFVQDLQDNKYAMVLRTVGPLAGGNFVNENTFIGGRYGTTSGTNALGSRYGVLITWDKVSSYRSQNTNRWLYPCFEIGGNTSGESIPVWLDGAGQSNQFVEARHESGVGVFAKVDGGASGTSYCYTVDNEFSVQYSSDTGSGFVQGIQELNGANNNIYKSAALYNRVVSTWNSGRLVDQVTTYGINRPYIRGPFFFVSNGSPTPSRWINAAGFIKTFKDDLYLDSYGVGVTIDTSKIKNFAFKTKTRSANSGRVFIRCYNSSGVQLILGGATAPHVMAGRTAMVNSGNYGGGCYSFSADGFTNTFGYRFGDDVAYAQIIFGGGTAPLVISSFDIIGFPSINDASGNSTMASITVYSGAAGSDFAALSLSKPGTTAGGYGSYSRGAMISNAVAAVGVPSHWSAITNDVGYLNYDWVINKVYAYTGEIVINGANAYVCTVAGTSAGSGGPTGTGTGIVDNTVTWNYLGPKAVFATSGNLV